MTVKRTSKNLCVVALIALSGQFSANAELFPPIGHDWCFVEEAAYEVIHDTGMETGEWVHPVLDSNGEVVRSVTVGEARQTKLPACISQSASQPMEDGQEGQRQQDIWGA